MIVALDTQCAVGTATGVGVYALDLVAALREAGIPVKTLAWPAFDPWRFDRRVLWDQCILPALLARSGAAVFHATSGTVPALRRIPTVVTVHDVAWLRVQQHARGYARAYFGSVMKRLYRGAEAVAVDSVFSRDEYRELSGDRRPVEIVAPGVDARFATLVRRPDVQPFALVVGTVERRKALERTLDVAAAIPDMRIVSVGPPTPYLEEVRRRARELGVTERLDIRGYVARAELDDLYARATLAIVPSTYEGFGYAVAEARCAGLPFVATRGSSLTEVAGDAGQLIEYADRDGWVEAVRAILADRDAAESRAAAQRASAIADFSWSRAAAEFIRIYARLAR